MQLNYARNMNEAVAGMLADLGPHDIETYNAEADLVLGLLLQDTGDVSSRQVSPVAALPSADPNSLVGDATPLALGAGEVVLTQADLDGAIGDAEIAPAQLLSIAMNAEADWLAGNFIFEAYGPEDVEKVERIPVTVGGDATIYSQLPYSRFHRLIVPAGDGAARTIEVGTSPTRYACSRVSFPGIGLYQPFGERVSSTVDVAAGREVNVLRRGRVWVVTEAAVQRGNPVYVRMVASGNNVRGQFRGSPAANFCRLAKAEWASNQATAGGLAVIELQ